MVAPVSPFGFGGTKDADGTLCAEDAAGSGGGVANPQYTQMLKDGERGDGEMTPRHGNEQLLLEAALYFGARRRLADIGAANAYRRTRLPGRLCRIRKLARCRPWTLGRAQWHGAQLISPIRKSSFTLSIPNRRMLVAARRQRPGHRRYVDVRPGDIWQTWRRNPGLARRRGLPAAADDRADHDIVLDNYGAAGGVRGGSRSLKIVDTRHSSKRRTEFNQALHTFLWLRADIEVAESDCTRVRGVRVKHMRRNFSSPLCSPNFELSSES